MNRFIIFFFLQAISLTAKSQGNLQFNQVINIDLSIPNAGATVAWHSQTSSITVPVGKVWKVESSGANATPNATNGNLSPNGGSFTNIQIRIDDLLVYLSNDNSSSTNHALPLWLPEGTHTLLIGTYNSSVPSYPAGISGKISIIEFNVVP